MNYKQLNEAAQLLARKWPDAKPSCGLVCGSGWGDVIEAFTVRGTLSYAEIPGLGATGVVGHAGKLIWGTSAGRETFIFQGRRHWYEGEGWTPIALPIFVMKARGVSAVVLTNAAGGIRKDLKPGDLMVIDDHISMIGANPLVGPHDPAWGPRFPDQSTVYNAELRVLADRAGQASGNNLKHGVYLAASGPTYETPAEIHAFRAMGADAVGMSTVPEAQLANACGMRVLGLSCITNFAAGISPLSLSHDEVVATTNAAMPRMRALLSALWKEFSDAGT